jgi:hypothetical protein
VVLWSYHYVISYTHNNFFRLFSLSILMVGVLARIEGRAKASCPERSVYAGKVEIHLVEGFHGVWSWVDLEVSHLTQPKVHSLCSPVSILVE